MSKDARSIVLLSILILICPSVRKRLLPFLAKLKTMTCHARVPFPIAHAQLYRDHGTETSEKHSSFEHPDILDLFIYSERIITLPSGIKNDDVSCPRTVPYRTCAVMQEQKSECDNTGAEK